MRTFILAHGKQERFGGLLSMPKQLVAVNGEPNLQRTVRLVRGLGFGDVDDITVVAPASVEWMDARKQVEVALWSLPDPTDTLCDTLAQVTARWTNGTVVMLHGDVIWSRARLRALYAATGVFAVTGRSDKVCWQVGAWRDEKFGFAVKPAGQEEARQRLTSPPAEMRAIPFQLLLKHFGDRGQMIKLDDYTWDLDSREDLKLLPAIEDWDAKELEALA